MENRFFDIDNNVYLNGLYLVLLIRSEDKGYNWDEINLKLFLMKNPHIVLNVCRNLGIEIPRDLFKEYQYLNLQADMSKYLLKVQVKGLMDAINFLYSKGLAEVNYQKGNLHATAKCMKMDLEIVPEKLINVANKINSIFQEVTMKDLKKVLFVKGDYLYE
jgi:hypothetical protein